MLSWRFLAVDGIEQRAWVMGGRVGGGGVYGSLEVFLVGVWRLGGFFVWGYRTWI